MTPPLLQVDHLGVTFPVPGRLPFQRAGVLHAVDDVSFSIGRGETLGLVGESGCGKTTVGRAIVALERRTTGSILFEGREIGAMSAAELRRTRRRIQFVFQDPYASLNPRMSVGEAIAEPVRLHGLASGERAVRARVADLLGLVGLSPSYAARYPHEFSGGQRQRVGIARALACEPDLIVCDEPVSSLDVSVQAQIVNLLQDLQERLGLAYLFIAHGLGVIHELSARVAVMYLGRIAEIGDKAAIYGDPRHPYTRALLSAVPIPDPKAERARRRIVLVGDVPSPLAPPAGCRFVTRCPIAFARCRVDAPPFVASASGRSAAACWRADEIDDLMPSSSPALRSVP